MKLKAYSQNNPAKHLVLHTVKRFLWLPFAILVLSGFVFAGTEILMENRILKMLITTATGSLYGFNNEEFWPYFPYFLIFFSVLSAYVMFAFLFKKKSSQAMLLTGVSRTTLFFTRYIYGLLSTIIPVLSMMLLMLALGASNFENGTPFAENTGMMLVIVCLTVLYTYTVAVIAATLCGRKIEFFVVSIVFCFGVQGLLLFAVLMCASFLNGFGYTIRDESNLPYRFPELFDKYSDLSINTLFKNAYSEYPRSGYKVPENDYGNVDLSVYGSQAIWLFVITLALVCLALYIFKNRKAEFDGKPNSNKALSAVCSVIISLVLSSLMLFAGKSAGILCGMAVLFIVLCGAGFMFFNGTARKAAVSLKYSLSGVVLIAVLILGLHFDVFGYSSKTPDISEIESVRMSWKCDGDYFTGKGTSGFESLLQATYVDFENFPELTEEADVKKAIEVHKMIIEDGSREATGYDLENYSDTVVNTDYHIVYKLKDGTEMVRFYRQMKLSTLFKTYAMEETAPYKEVLENNLVNPYNLGFHEYENSTFALSDNMLSNAVPIELTAEEKTELINALATDKADESFEERYHPEKECVGVLWRSFQDDGVKIRTGSMVLIYEQDKNTLDWLEEKDFTNAFSADYTVKSIEIFKLNYYVNEFVSEMAVDRIYKPEFNQDMFIGARSGIKVRDVDENEFGSILQKTRLHYFTDKGNEFAVITLINKNGEEIKTTKYLVD
ncbi:MAG: ABC transporter permease [Clostridia bacterium]|nr:ABC transporter permease [Clostridia bacterium]